MKSYNIVEPGNDVSMKYSKFVLTPKLISGPDPASSSVILGEYKWCASFLIFYLYIEE